MSSMSLHQLFFVLLAQAFFTLQNTLHPGYRKLHAATVQQCFSYVKKAEDKRRTQDVCINTAQVNAKAFWTLSSSPRKLQLGLFSTLKAAVCLHEEAFPFIWQLQPCGINCHRTQRGGWTNSIKMKMVFMEVNNWVRKIKRMASTG